VVSEVLGWDHSDACGPTSGSCQTDEMPRRTTPFQRAVYYLKAHLAENGTTVTESHMLRDRVTGEEREVDVVLKAQIVGHPVTIGIECRERGRRADSPWVESMHGKHATLPTDHLVLVSSSGFTGPARAKAEQWGYECIEPDDALEENTRAFIRRLQTIWFASVDIRVDEAYLHVGATGHWPSGVVQLDEGWLIFSPDGSRLCNGRQLVETVKQHMMEKRELRDAGESSQRFRFEFRPAGEIFIEVSNPTTTYRIPVLQVDLVGFVRVRKAAIEMAQGSLQGVAHSYGEAMVGDRRAASFLTQTSEDQATLTLEITAANLPPTDPSLEGPTSDDEAG
jgi:hypothetical protein